MSRSHVDVDLPASLLPNIGTLLEEFHAYVLRRGFRAWRLEKDPERTISRRRLRWLFRWLYFWVETPDRRALGNHI